MYRLMNLALLALTLCVQARSAEIAPPPMPLADTSPQTAARRATLSANVRVTVDRYELSLKDNKSFQMLAEARDEKTLGPGDGLGVLPGVQVFATQKPLSSVLEPHEPTGRWAQRGRQLIVLSADTKATLQLLVFRPRLVNIPIYQGPSLVRTFKEEITGSGLIVRVHGITEKGVDVELLPYFDRADMWPPMLIPELRTRALVPAGGSLVVLPDRDHPSEFSTHFLQSSQDGKTKALILSLTANSTP